VQNVNQLREEVEAFSRTFPLPGYPDYWELYRLWLKLLTEWENCISFQMPEYNIPQDFHCFLLGISVYSFNMFLYIDSFLLCVVNLLITF
jgi:hypothetical protein